ncbi:MAG: MFS transporter [Rhizobiaceae bacterium]|nr:MFS transporter [Rhizobiaceae bacterium]
MRLVTVIVLLAAGILAGTQLGKIAPLVGWYQSEVGFSLVLTGWFTAMIGLFVAAAALPAGWAVERVGLRISFAASAVVLTAGGIGLALLSDPTEILVARLVEGLGYLVLVIAIPALLNAVPTPRWRPAALAIWGGFVAIGFAVGDFLASATNATQNPQTFLMTAVLLFAAFALPATLLLWRIGPIDSVAAAVPAAGRFARTFGRPVILLTLAFGIYVILSVGYFAFLPAFVSGSADRILLSAGVISLSTPLGNLLAGLVVRSSDVRPALRLAAAGFVCTAVSAIPAYLATTPLVATTAIVALAISGGVTASALFAGLPPVVPAQGSVAVAIGLICQSGGIGTLLGPPLAAYFIEVGGWHGFGSFMAATALAGLLVLSPLLVPRSLETAQAD